MTENMTKIMKLFTCRGTLDMLSNENLIAFDQGQYINLIEPLLHLVYILQNTN